MTKKWESDYNKPIEFTGYYTCLENSFPVTILVGGIRYPSVEHALQATKVSSSKCKDVLISTGARPLLSPKDAMMGKILMKIRNEIVGRAN